MRIRFGIGWRKEIADSILRNIDHFDILEVIIDDYVDASRKELDFLKFLNSQVPIKFHGIQLGLASSIEVDLFRLKKYKRVLDYTKIQDWSEHLAFVRGKKTEIFHLAQPPMNLDTLDGLKRNLKKVKNTIGSLPLMENPASLIFPPGSEWNEIEWMKKVLEETELNLLLDLHNLYANSVNFNFSALDYLNILPNNRVKSIHLAGGRKVGDKILDTHLHPIPKQVYDLLRYFSKKGKIETDLIIERDGKFPEFIEILKEVNYAREIFENKKEESPTGRL